MNKFTDFTKRIFEGKTVGRIIFNWQVKDHCGDVSGVTVDFAGDGKWGYYEYLPPKLKIIKTNYKKKNDTDIIVDLNGDLPFDDGSVDNILFFNAFYIIKDQQNLLNKFKKILKKGGKIYMSSPFIANEMPEPHDYKRQTYEGIELMIKEAGFGGFKIFRYGERFTASAHLLHPFFMFNFVRFFTCGLAILLDGVIPANIRKSHPAPLGYFCVIEK